MKRTIFSFAVGFLLLCASAYPQDNFPRGIFLFNRDSVDFEPLKDSLNLNWVQGKAQDENGNPRAALLENGHGLKVMGYMMQNNWEPPTATNLHSYQASSGQHMVFEAEQGPGDPMQNYFADKPNGQPDPLTPGTIKSTGSYGFMVKSAVPDTEYNYNRANYIASFVVKIEWPQSGNPQVADLQVVDNANGNTIAHKDLSYSDFSNGNFKTFQVPFSLSYTPPLPLIKGPGTLRASPRPPSVITCKKVDLRVDWYGGVPTWLDKIIVEDSIGMNLNAGHYDTNIATDASLFNSHTLLQRAYLADEPLISSFTSFKYVQDKIRSTVTDNDSGRGRGITANYRYFDRFLYDGQPNELLVDGYTISADIPSPSMTDGEASGVGIVTGGDYTALLQPRIDSLIARQLSPAAIAVKNVTPRPDIWYVPQLHGVYFPYYGRFRASFSANDSADLRPPTGNEIKMTIGLALAYGAKGIIAYPYDVESQENYKNGHAAIFAGPVTDVPVGGFYKNHWTNTGTFPSTFSSGGTKEVKMGYQEKWDALREINAKLQQLGPTLMNLTWQNAFSIHKGQPSGTFVTNVSTNFPSETYYVELGIFRNFSTSTDYFMLVNRRTLSSESRSIAVTLNNTGFNEILEISSGKKFIIGASGTFTDTFSPGEGKLYKISPFSFTDAWSGDITLTSSVTVPPQTTLRINPGTSVKFVSGKSLVVNGALYAVGEASNLITFDRAGTSGSWNSIIFSGSGAAGSHLTYCTVQHSYGIQCNDGANVFIDHCSISDGTYGVLCEESSPVISNSYIHNISANGVNLAYGSNPRIEHDTITNSVISSGFGVYLYNASAYINCNTISGFTIGVYPRTTSYLGGWFGTNDSGGYNYTPTQNNVIIGNTYGVDTWDHGYVFLGYDDGAVHGGNNALVSNIVYDLVANDNTSIWADGDWFGDDLEPTTAQGTYYAYLEWGALEDNPWPGHYLLAQPVTRQGLVASLAKQSTVVVLNSTNIQTKNSDAGEEKLFQEAVSAHMSKSYVNAQQKYRQLISSKKYSASALVLLSHLFRESDDASVLTYFEDLKSDAKSHSLDEVNLPLITNLLANMYGLRGNYVEALALYDDVIKKYPNTIEERNARVQKIYYTLAGVKDESSAKQQLSELLDKYKSGDDIEMIKNFVDHSVSSPGNLFKALPKNGEVSLTITEYSLSANYPNPFNPVTSIDYQIPKDGMVTLKVYDMLGREVQTLVNDYKTTGRYSVEFNAGDFSSGMYIYRMASGEYAAVKKMLMIK
jgi:tetratricopeptide (TPR) repeat protein